MNLQGVQQSSDPRTHTHTHTHSAAAPHLIPFTPGTSFPSGSTVPSTACQHLFAHITAHMGGVLRRPPEAWCQPPPLPPAPLQHSSAMPSGQWTHSKTSFSS
eukprot:3142606-Amphidinium_carterae.1